MKEEKYDFINVGKFRVTEAQVKQVIKDADYDPDAFDYEARTDESGFLVTGEVAMNLNDLKRAAENLHLRIEISSPNDLAIAATPFNLKIKMDRPTVLDLKAGKFHLFAFKGAQVSGDAKPLLWFTTDTYNLETELSWTEKFQAYISKTEIKNGVKIDASTATSIDLGQKWKIENPSGGTVVNGEPRKIAILNTLEGKFTSGISQEAPDGTMSMLCAVPLFGNNSENRFAPINKVLVGFATSPFQTGTVIVQSFSAGFLIDFSRESKPVVTYSTEKGWATDPGQGIWGKAVPPDAKLADLLFEPVPRALKQIA